MKITSHEEIQLRSSFHKGLNDSEKKEFIGGKIFQRTTETKAHHDVCVALFNLLNNYVIKNKLGFVGYEKIMISLTRNDYEPDLCFFNREKSDLFTSDQSLFPAADLVIEVLSDNTAKNDREIKFFDYQAHGILEYWLIEPFKQEVEQYRLVNGQYELIIKSGEGHIRCEAVDGFAIDIQAIFNQQKNQEELSSILSQPLK